jgi:calcineurin-like phosphoesterase family protein
VRTLVISDLHLGSRLERDVLRRPAALAALLDALDGVDRLVLLGDTVELMERRATQAMAIAEPVLRAIGARIGPGSEVILVPGNHDAPLVRRWLRTTGGPAGVDATVPPDATAALARVVEWLGGPARVRVHYPGVWLTDRAWATHGHYLDRHLLPEGGYGVTRGLLGRVPLDGATPAEYERSASRPLARVETAMSRAPRPLTAVFDDLAELARAATMPRVRRRVLRRRFAPVTSLLLGLQMRRASLPALAHVVHRLGVEAEHVIFGHVHRVGPLPGDDLRRWIGPTGRPAMANTGAWVYEAILVHRARPPHPYWPGGAVILDGEGPPRAVGLLDHLDGATLQSPQTRAGRRPSRT